MSGPDLNPSAQDYWPRAFARAVGLAEAQRENPGLWARFLGLGVRYRLDDRAALLQRLLADVAGGDSSPEWRAVVRHDPIARKSIEALAGEAEDGAGLGELAAQARKALKRMPEGSDMAGPLPPGVAGHIRVVVDLPRRGFSVEDLMAGTTPISLRSVEQRALLVNYATSVPVVDRALERADGEWRLPGDEPAPVVDFLCLAASSNPIGTAERPEDGRSLDLGLLLAAASHRFGWRMRSDRVVATGTLDLDDAAERLGRIAPVSHIQEKLEAIVKWMGTLPPSSLEGPRAEVILPAANAPEANEGARRIGELGGRVHFVGNVEEAIAALPLDDKVGSPRRRGLGTVTWVIVLMMFVLWSERLFVGEFLADPETRRRHDVWIYGAISFGPALLPVSTVIAIFRSEAQTMFKRGSARPRMLTLLVGAAAHAMFFLQYLLGALDFPADTTAVLRSTDVVRIGCVYKDIAIGYPLLITVFAVYPLRAHRQAPLAWHERERGRVRGPRWHALRRLATEVPAWHQIVRWGMVVIGSVMLLLFARDFVDAWERRNYVIVGHIFYQIFWPIVMGSIVAGELSKELPYSTRSRGATAVEQATSHP